MLTRDCPSCNRSLQQSGVVTTDDGKTFPVFQCEHCVRKTTLFGGEIEVALTFAVDDAGNVFDPDDDQNNSSADPSAN